MSEQEATMLDPTTGPTSEKENEKARQAVMDRLPRLSTPVWFYETADGPPLAAIVTGAKDGLLGLAVFEPSGAAVNRTDVLFLTARDESPAAGMCYCTLPE